MKHATNCPDITWCKHGSEQMICFLYLISDFISLFLWKQSLSSKSGTVGPPDVFWNNCKILNVWLLQCGLRALDGLNRYFKCQANSSSLSLTCGQLKKHIWFLTVELKNTWPKPPVVPDGWKLDAVFFLLWFYSNFFISCYSGIYLNYLCRVNPLMKSEVQTKAS